MALPIVLGPTGSGKSELGLRVARELGGEIVNCDSLQLYRGLDIGTAKVPETERQGVPHHLIDVIEPAQLFTAGEYARAARGVLCEIAVRGRTPVLVGGTGFYLRALLEGLSEGPQRDTALRDRLQRRENRRPGSLHRILARLDPESASRIHPNDKNKTLRALEVRLLEGGPMSALFARGRAALAGFRPIRLGLDPPRELLYRRLDERTARMFERGLIEEVRGLLAAGVPPDAKPFESLGYRQALAVLQGRLTLPEAIASTQTETRRYAKRQMTWFRKEPHTHWLHGFGDTAPVLAEALEIIHAAAREPEPATPPVL
ncbi:MAG TPA: tRNA (adenosine(37)-N6)-dimethylallyltransferase MiaA [Bryobacteraceae bacterium]|nr:tRNA (adenosine(37)-N6)-dimethylallyltransferase MiaA [Bryobacteraceae bacterium]